MAVLWGAVVCCGWNRVECSYSTVRGWSTVGLCGWSNVAGVERVKMTSSGITKVL